MVALRREYGWGAKKIEVLLREEGITLTVSTINRILKRRGLVGKKDSHAPALERFERATPNELWQMDGKGSIAAAMERVIRYRFSMITAATRWGCTGWWHSRQSKCIPAWCARLSATACRKRC